MRVYDHGLLWTELKITCPNCGCDFIYKPKDIQQHIEYDFETTEGKVYKYIQCPECAEKCIYTDPVSDRTYNDSLKGTPVSNEPPESPYDGGDLDGDSDGENDGGNLDDNESSNTDESNDNNGPIYDEDGNEEL